LFIPPCRSRRPPLDAYTLPGLLRLARPDRVLFGSDYPHAWAVIIDKALESLRTHELGPETHAAITQANANRLLGESRA
jgi:predicted TIM-barrel fold metal-dependent hydrolase